MNRAVKREKEFKLDSDRTAVELMIIKARRAYGKIRGMLWIYWHRVLWFFGWRPSDDYSDETSVEQSVKDCIELRDAMEETRQRLRAMAMEENVPPKKMEEIEREMRLRSLMIDVLNIMIDAGEQRLAESNKQSEGSG